MTSNKPYLVKAFYDWLLDNDLTPHIVVDVSVYGVLVPMSYVNDGQIILNISPSAVGTIALGNETIELSARFGGKLELMVVPYGAVGAIYAKENGAGTSLPIEHPPQEDESIIAEPTKAHLSDVSTSSSGEATSVNDKAKSKNKPGLRVVK